MREAAAIAGERLFTEFLDPVDMTGVFPAEMRLEEINRIAGEAGLRFPLVCAEGATLPEHVRVVDHAPASSRFGPYVDNILGMNWKLPSGRMVRIGERVVKTTTGYDLMRFLLHTGADLGRPTHFVLRLRPLGGETLRGEFTGDDEALRAVGATLCADSWNHWIDRIDLLAGERETVRLQVAVDCMCGEGERFEAYFGQVAERAGATFAKGPSLAETGLPFFSVKGLPGEAARTARRCVEALGGRARALLLTGSVLVYPDKEVKADWIRTLEEELEAIGGHLLGNVPGTRIGRDDEAQWIRQMEEQWKRL
ncbi:MAG: hypothetical protein R6V45_11850 [Oceanipulchritudo sp.]